MQVEKHVDPPFDFAHMSLQAFACQGNSEGPDNPGFVVFQATFHAVVIAAPTGDIAIPIAFVVARNQFIDFFGRAHPSGDIEELWPNLVFEHLKRSGVSG